MKPITLASGLLAFVIYVQPALACRCIDPSLPRAYKQADSVAEVRIETVSAPTSDGTITAVGETLTAWKTELPAHVNLVTGDDCAYPFQASHTYILFLSAGESSWGTYKCRGNKPIANANKTVEWLKRNGATRKPK